MRTDPYRLIRRLVFAPVLLGLAGCAGVQAYREGNQLLANGRAEEGLAKLEAATRIDPRNAEYRIALLRQREFHVQARLRAAKDRSQAGDLNAAEASYREALALDPNHHVALEGLQAVDLERRHSAIVREAEVVGATEEPAKLAAALERLHTVLQENPRQRDALALRDRLNAKRQQVQSATPRLDPAYRRSITLEFREAPMRSVFDAISKVSGLSFFFDKELRVDQKITILARNTTVEDALRLLLVTNQLEHKVLNESSVLIFPNSPQKLRDYQSLTVRTFYLVNADVKAVSNTIKTIVKTKDLVIDERLGLIIMRDTPEAIRMAERLVALQDLSDPEVVLQVEIAEVQRSRLLELGIRWPNQLSLNPLSGTGGTFLTLQDLLQLNRSTIQATVGGITLHAGKEDTDGSVLANPRIRVRNKEKARVMIGDRVPVITTTSSATGFVSESVNYIDVGLKLEVEPNIYLDDEVAIKVNLEVSSLVRQILSPSGSLSYQIGSREASTVLRLRDGETQVLAGLISDEDRKIAQKVPGIGEVPVLGRLFGSHQDDSVRSEILLAITPHIVRGLRRPAHLMTEFDSGTEASIGADVIRLSPAASRPVARRGASAPSANSEVSIPAKQHDAQIDQEGPALAGPLALSWQTPRRVTVGRPFDAVLHAAGTEDLLAIPMELGFDPKLFEVVSVSEGDFFSGAGASAFTHRTDPIGRIVINAGRMSEGSERAGRSTRRGRLVTVKFKPLAPSPRASLQVLSAVPSPAPASPLAVPMEQTVEIAPASGS